MADIVGTSAAETLANNAGQDDTITGLAGHDTFVYSRLGAGQTDVLTDFGSMYFSATATGTQEVPPNESIATASLTAALSRGNDALSFSLDIAGLDLGGQIPGASNDIVSIQFHRAPVGQNGGTIFGFFGTFDNDEDGDTTVDAPGGNVSGEWDADEGNLGETLTSELDNLLEGDLYVNIHTMGIPGGEIRGQIGAADEGLDQLDVTGANIGDWETMQFLLEDNAGSVIFSTRLDGSDHTMVLLGVNEADLNAEDFIFAGSVNQNFIGGDNDDDLFGAGGKDNIRGGRGDDRLFGESGSDSLIGGRGRDLLTGGGGDDDFIFKKTGDSQPAPAKRDVINDFNVGGDRINLNKIDADAALEGNQAFFFGGDTFDNIAGELIQVDAGDDSLLGGDTDGDGDADFVILLVGVQATLENDILF
jgi:Ca2+-binding RTX toxin-like protein